MEADFLAKLASEANKVFKTLEQTAELNKPSTEEMEVMNTQEVADWMKPIIEYLGQGILPLNKLKALKIKLRAAHYSLSNEELYKDLYLIHGRSVYPQTKATMCSKKSMRESVGPMKLKAR